MYIVENFFNEALFWIPAYNGLKNKAMSPKVLSIIIKTQYIKYQVQKAYYVYTFQNNVSFIWSNHYGIQSNLS